MATYLLTWNPRRFPWNEFADDIIQLRDTGPMLLTWSCGNTRRIQSGDRFFMMRLGEEPRGIVGSGVVLVGPNSGAHWDSEQAAQGETSLFVETLLETLRDARTEAILPYEVLRTDPLLSAMHWTPQASGVRIPEEIASEVERRWLALLTGEELPPPDEVMLTESFQEGSVREVLVNSYERSSSARRRCIEHYGAQCVVCGFDFAAVYGSIGMGYIHVHHEVPLAEIGEAYEVDPIQDLKPVCPNCHAMLHRRRPAYSLAELRVMLSRRAH